MSLNYRALGQRIKAIRQQNQLSQLMFSELIEKSPTYVSYIETGNRSMSLDTFVEIANALEVPTDMLLTEQLRGSPVSASQEFTLLLSDCSDYERLIIINTAKAIKEALREHRYMLNRDRR